MGRCLLAESTAQSGHTVDQIVLIFDMEGLAAGNFNKRVLNVTKKLFAIDSNNYPECNGGIWIVNANWVFNTIWKVVSPFLDSFTRSKIQVMGSGSSAKQKLLDAFGPDLLPDFLGGRSNFQVRQRPPPLLASIPSRAEVHQHAAQGRRFGSNPFKLEPPPLSLKTRTHLVRLPSVYSCSLFNCFAAAKQQQMLLPDNWKLPLPNHDTCCCQMKNLDVFNNNQTG